MRHNDDVGGSAIVVFIRKQTPQLGPYCEGRQEVTPHWPVRRHRSPSRKTHAHLIWQTESGERRHGRETLPHGLEGWVGKEIRNVSVALSEHTAGGAISQIFGKFWSLPKDGGELPRVRDGQVLPQYNIHQRQNRGVGANGKSQ